jgi:hypothetical protein
MLIRRIPDTVVFLAVFCFAAAAQGDQSQADKPQHGEIENPGTTITGQALDRIKKQGDQRLVRARDLLRTVYGNHRARIQEALRRNAVIKKNAEKLMNATGAKFLGLGPPIAEME